VSVVRRPARRIGALAALTLLTLLPAVGPTRVASGQGAGQPNILVFLTDDQRATDTLEHMPRTRQWFGQGGTTFTNAFATTPLCCPSRASIFTGRMAHNTNVRTNGDQNVLNHNSTIQRYLSQRNYRTALSGKFLNLWPVAQNPPNFDRWALLKPEDTGYFNSQFNVDGTTQVVGGYSTDYLRDYALGLLDEWEANDARPWFLFVSPYAPHDPADPAARHANATFPPWPGNPAVFETDRRDKPPYVKRAPHTFATASADRERQLRTLLPVDEMVDAVLTRLQQRGEENTLAFFLSDNGFFWAEHGLRGKNAPYTESIRIPYLVRWPGRIEAGTTDGRPVANIDVVATIMDAVGVSPDPQFPLDGRSLLKNDARAKMYTESWPPKSRGPWASVRTDKYQYIEYYKNNGKVERREYYDMVLDPWQLTNLYADGNSRNNPWDGALEREVGSLRKCRGETCDALLDEPGIPLRCPGAKAKPGHHLVGSNRPDRIGGPAWSNVICGRNGADTLRGKGGRDRLIGHQGADILIGGPDRDLLDGKGGRDVCRGGPGKDRFRNCAVKAQ
jgi:arylsulfatase A-like enzyme